MMAKGLIRIWRRIGVVGGIILPVLAWAQTWNNPHVQSGSENVAYLAFTNPPKTLDPARSYSVDEAQFTAQIYEPPLQYAYLTRPYALIPSSAASMPAISYRDAQGNLLPDNPDPNRVAYTLYDITIQPGIFYQPHPAFARDANGRFFYLNLNVERLEKIHTLADFKFNGTRELTADDFVYQIKRLADPTIQSPIYGLMSQYIVGLAELAKQLQNQYKAVNLSRQITPYIDLRKYPLEGAKTIDRYHYQIKIQGFYPQFKFWLAMPFFAPMPWEAVFFYSQKGMAERNITLDWYPVGTGPYMLVENNPNREMILQRNPNFHDEFYPDKGDSGDAEKGYLKNAGKKLPLTDKFVFTLDRESIPRWNKFMQGYYDLSGVSADSFDQAVQVDEHGKMTLTSTLQNKAIRLDTAVIPAVFYLGFNMLDPIIGGYSEAQQKLRQAISIALNQEQYIHIFLNGRGIPAQGPIPPEIFGYQTGAPGINPWVYVWEHKHAVRRPLDYAKELLRQAGYPDGRDLSTGRALILNLDIVNNGSPDDNAQYNWYRKQFSLLGIELNIRATLYNSFQDRVRTGAAQIFSWGWQADYPDPENFLFLLYGPNGKVKFGGENAANYANPRADQLFTEIADLPDGEQRQEKINQFLQIVRQDSPWIWGFNPVIFTFSHIWVMPIKANAIANNTLKYVSLDGTLRAKLRKQWNQPLTWPLWLLIFLLIVLSIPLIITYWLRQRRPNVKRFG